MDESNFVKFTKYKVLFFDILRAAYSFKNSFWINQ